MFLKATLIRAFQNFLLNNHFEEIKPRISVYPYLSGDAFLGIADACVLRNFSKPIILRNNPPEIIFVETGLIQELNL